jgi:nitrite reductase (NADH) small subunit
MTTATAPAPVATSATVALLHGQDWIEVCDTDRLVPGRGVAVLLPDGDQAAVFRDRHGALYAVHNRDPFTGAYVMSRGLLGSTAEGRTFVASPLLKQRFDLSSGECLDDGAVSVPAYRVRVG